MPQKGHYANECPEIKEEDTMPLKVRKMDEGITKMMPRRNLFVRFSDLENGQKTHI